MMSENVQIKTGEMVDEGGMLLKNFFRRVILRIYPELREAHRQYVRDQKLRARQKKLDERSAKAASKAAAKAQAIQSKREAQLDRSFLALVPRERTGADAEYVKENYEAHWGKRIDGVRSKLAAGETLAHIVSQMRPPAHRIKGLNRVSSGPSAGYIASRGLAVDDDGAPNIRLGVAGGRYTAVSNFEPLRAIELLSRKVTNIVELGAGPGWNLFDLSIQMGSAVQGKRLWGLEYTDAGVELMNVVAAHQKIPLTAHHFNYLDPDISMIPDDESALIFSHHSIEQVEDISPRLHKQILQRRKPTYLVHCEPIGWQRFGEFTEARSRGSQDAWRVLARGRTADLEDERTQALNAALNSWRLGYNRNALGLIDGFAQNERVQTICREYDFTHRNNVNAANPSTYIAMRLN